MHRLVDPGDVRHEPRGAALPRIRRLQRSAAQAHRTGDELMLGKIARFAGGRRTKWVVVGIWLLMLVLSTLPGKLTDVTEDRIASFLPDTSAALVADQGIEEPLPARPHPPPA